MENNKIWYKSKIIWLSIATIIIGASEYFPILGQYVPDNYQGMFTALTGILIVIARAYSNHELTSTNKQEFEEEVETTKPKNNSRNMKPTNNRRNKR